MEKVLKGQEIFEFLTPKQISKLSEFSKEEIFQAHKVIFDPETKSSNLYILLDGLVELLIPAQAKTFTIGIIKVHEGDLFGAGSLIGMDQYNLKAQCVNKSTLLTIDAKKLTNLLEEDKVTGFYIMRYVANVYYRRYIDVKQRLQDHLV